MLLRSTLFNLFGVIFCKGSNYLVIILLARTIGVDEFGKFGLIQSALATFAIILGGDVALSATKFVAEYSRSNIGNARLIYKICNVLLLVLVLVFALVGLLIQNELSFLILKSYSYNLEILLAIISMVIMTFNLINTGVLAGYNQFKYILYSNILRGIVGIAVLVPFILEVEMKGYYIGLNIVLLIENRIINYFHFKTITAICDTDLTVLNKKVLFEFFKKFTLPSMLSASLYAPSIFLFNYIASSYSKGFYNLGLFNAINQLSIMMVVVASAMSQPLLSRMLDNKVKIDVLAEQLNMSIGVFLGLAFSIPILIFPEIIGLIFGPDYMEFDLTFPILFMVLTTNVILFKQGVLRLIVSRGNMRDSIVSNLIWSLLLILGILFLFKDGLSGISFAFFMAYLINTMIIIPYYIKVKLIQIETLKQLIIYMAIPLIAISLYLGVNVNSFTCRLLGAGVLYSILFTSYFHENRSLFKGY